MAEPARQETLEREAPLAIGHEDEALRPIGT